MQRGAWSRYFIYRTNTIKTTWTFRFALVACLLLLVFLALKSRRIWIPEIGRSLICEKRIRPADAILVENFDVDYLPFELAGALERQGLSSRVLIPIAVRPNGQATSVAEGIVDLMTRLARLENWQTIPSRQIEPISLNVAKQVREFLIGERIRSVIVVAPGLRSKRSALVYDAVLAPAGIAVSCAPTEGGNGAEMSILTWHGVQDVALQFLKLQYYRFWVLPLASRTLAARG